MAALLIRLFVILRNGPWQMTLRDWNPLPGNLYNFHPGSHVKQGTDVGISYIADMLNEILKPDQTTTVAPGNHVRKRKRKSENALKN